jgi:hypothetical protein
MVLSGKMLDSLNFSYGIHMEIQLTHDKITSKLEIGVGVAPDGS